MKSNPVKNLISEPMFLPGLVLLLLNTSTSHAFYHVNSFKIVLMVLGMTLVSLRHLPPLPSSIGADIPWKIWLILAIPLLATFPGLFLYGGAYNYNFRYELVTNLLLFLWVVYLFRSFREERDFWPLFRIIGIIIIYNGCWSVLERTGFLPLAWNEPVRMVKATFGHRNYFSGFLVILIPLMAVFAVPDSLFQSQKHETAENRANGYRFYLVVFLAAVLSLALAQTRAAIAACGISLILTGYIYLNRFAPLYWRRRYLILLGFLAAAGCGLIAFVLNFPNLFAGSRFAELLTVRAWLGRTLSWETAINAIKSSPLFGYGLGSSYNLFFSFVDPDARLFHNEHSYNHAHSEILEFTQEGGIIGLLILIAFWVWLIHRLIRLMKHPGISSMSLKILIGICGGFLAYHIHGSFSVAPRMIVTKLPLYTLIAILLTLDTFYHAKHGAAANRHPSACRRAISGLPTLAILGVIWILYFPWASTQWQFNRIREERPSFLQIQQLKRLTRLSPDIYALDYLSHRQIEYKQAAGLKRTLKMIAQIIPHYRDLGYKQTVQAILEEDLQKTRQLGLAAQRRDRYFQPTIDLMMALAVKTDDLTLFKKQFALSLRRHAFTNQVINSLEANDVRILFLPSEDPLNITGDSARVTFQWSERLIGILFDTARKSLGRKDQTSSEKTRYYAFLMQLLLKQSWFQLNIKPPYQGERRQLLMYAGDYNRLKQTWKKQKIAMEQTLLKELRMTGPGRKEAIFHRQQKALATARAKQTAKMQVLAEKLTPKTDWKLYINKQNFAESFAKNLISIIFPTTRR